MKVVKIAAYGSDIGECLDQLRSISLDGNRVEVCTKTINSTSGCSFDKVNKSSSFQILADTLNFRESIKSTRRR